MHDVRLRNQRGEATVMPLDNKAPEPKWMSHHIKLYADGFHDYADIIDAKTGEIVINPGEFACPESWKVFEIVDMGHVMGRMCVSDNPKGSE